MVEFETRNCPRCKETYAWCKDKKMYFNMDDERYVTPEGDVGRATTEVNMIYCTRCGKLLAVDVNDEDGYELLNIGAFNNDR